MEILVSSAVQTDAVVIGQTLYATLKKDEVKLNLESVINLVMGYFTFGITVPVCNKVARKNI